MRSAASPRRSQLWAGSPPRPSPTRARSPAQLAQHAEALAAVGRGSRRSSSGRSTSPSSIASTACRRSSAISPAAARRSRRRSARFAANVEDSFARAQARAQEISAALASATKGASIAVAGQFETIRDTAAKERERTAQTLQATLEQTNAQLSGALEHAADRFRQSVAEVKEMASQVQRELDADAAGAAPRRARAAQETSETADAMRRVVSDQIRALKELAALVSDSGATSDVAEPRGDRSAPRALEKPGRDSRDVAERVRVASEAASARAPKREARLPTEGRVGSAHLNRLGPALSALGRGPRLADGHAQPHPGAAGFDSGRPSRYARRLERSRPGRDGCRTCSRPPRATSRTGAAPTGAETLEALTREIAGLIDNAAAVEMWDRWRRGDSGGRVAPSLHRGRPTGVRRNPPPLSRRPGVPRHATRYMQEFERLLAKVSQNDRDGSQWRAYLLSNTGKVYTILAHASGRLG